MAKYKNTKYVRLSEFQKHEAVINFPNTNMKIVRLPGETELTKLIVAGTIEVKELTPDECKFYDLLPKSFQLTSTINGFPTELLMTIKNGWFVDGNKLGARVGNNLGTASIGVVDLERSLEILRKNNFIIGSINKYYRVLT